MDNPPYINESKLLLLNWHNANIFNCHDTVTHRGADFYTIREVHNFFHMVWVIDFGELKEDGVRAQVAET